MLGACFVDLGRVTSVPRPFLIALLAAMVIVFALYTLELKPSASGPAGGPKSTSSYQSDINSAKAVQGLVNGAAKRDGGTPGRTLTPTSPASQTPTTTTTSPAAGAPGAQSHTTTGATTVPTQPTIGSLSTVGAVIGGIAPAPASPSAQMTAAQRFRAVQVALQQHKVLALLFYNPSSSDDRAVAAELASIPTHAHAVLRLAVPLQEMSAYSTLLAQVPVNFSPTLVVINHQRQATEIAGFADSFEITQRVDGALHS